MEIVEEFLKKKLAGILVETSEETPEEVWVNLRRNFLEEFEEDPLGKTEGTLEAISEATPGEISGVRNSFRSPNKHSSYLKRNRTRLLESQKHIWRITRMNLLIYSNACIGKFHKIS